MIYHHRNTMNQRCTFKNRDWLVDIMLDKCRRQVYQKAVQCGISTKLEIDTMAEMMRGHSVLYVMPSFDDRSDFINSRLDPVVDTVDLYRRGREQKNKKTVDNVGIKRFWNGQLKSVGSNRKGSMASYTAQCIIIDEVDLCNQENLLYAEDRTSAAKLLMRDENDQEILPRMIFCGNPSTPNHGISEMYDMSDKKQYMFQCSGCGLWQPFDWFENVVSQVNDGEYELKYKEPMIVCSKCNKPVLNIDDVKKQWIAEHPEKSMLLSGWHISQLFTKQFTVAELYDGFIQALDNSSKLQAFYNSRLGLPFTGGDDTLDIGTLIKCVKDYKLPSSSKGCCAGIDVGKVFHARFDRLVDGVGVMQFAGTYNTPKELVQGMVKYGVRTACIDADPEQHTVKSLQGACRALGINLWKVRYNPSPLITDMKINRDNMSIALNRTESLDRSLARYIHGQKIIPKSFRTIDRGEWIKQMMAPVRMLDIKRNPPQYVWVEGNKKDHHRHSDNLCNVACELIGYGNRQTTVQWLE